MGALTEQEKNRLREYLHHQGLSFKPLQDEMFDHIGCDLEERMAQGLSFQEAWDQSTTEIPTNHFQHIQQEVMETINKRFTWSQGLSFFALGLILMGILFKTLHLQFAGEVLLLSFVFLAASLLTGSLSGILLNRRKDGVTRVLAVVAGIIALLVGFSFKILHLTGADQMMMLAVALLIISVVVNSIHVYQHTAGRENLLTYLHEKHTPGIERFLLFLVAPLIIYKVVLILMGTKEFLGSIMLLIVSFGAGLQLIVLTWRAMEKDLAKKRATILMATIGGAFCFILPFLGQLLPLPVRIMLITLFCPVAGWLAYNVEEPGKPIHVFLVGLVTTIFLGWALIHLSVIPWSSSWIFFNIPLTLLLIAGVFISSKHGSMRAFMLVSLAGYLFEYMS